MTYTAASPPSASWAAIATASHTGSANQPAAATERLEERDQHGGGAIDAAQDRGQPAPIGEEPADHRDGLQQLRGDAGGQQLLRLEPGAAREVDRVALLVELLGAMRVGGERQAGAGAPAARARLSSRSRRGLPLISSAVPDTGRRLEHARPVDGQRVAPVDDAPRRMGQDVDMRGARPRRARGG